MIHPPAILLLLPSSRSDVHLPRSWETLGTVVLTSLKSTYMIFVLISRRHCSDTIPRNEGAGGILKGWRFRKPETLPHTRWSGYTAQRRVQENMGEGDFSGISGREQWKGLCQKPLCQISELWQLTCPGFTVTTKWANHVGSRKESSLEIERRTTIWLSHPAVHTRPRVTESTCQRFICVPVCIVKLSR